MLPALKPKKAILPLSPYLLPRQIVHDTHHQFCQPLIQWLNLTPQQSAPTKVNLSGLSLVVGLALLEVLRDYGAMGLKLKWPNDIYYQ
jgi:hypothetical protein